MDFSYDDLLAMSAVGIAVTVLAALSENSGKTTGRLAFLGWSVLYFAIMFIAITILFALFAEGALRDRVNLMAGGITAGLLITFGYNWLTTRLVIRRLRDRGHGRLWLIVLYVPLVNIFFVLYLLLAPGDVSVGPMTGRVERREPDGDFERPSGRRGFQPASATRGFR